MTNEHFTAWLCNIPSMLDQPNMDINVLEDELIGDPEEGEVAWACIGGESAFYAVTDMPADDYEGNPLPEAERILTEAGWARAGEWSSVDTGYTLTVTRAEA